MRVTVELSYEMSKVFGTERMVIEDVRTVAELVDKARAAVGDTIDEHISHAAVVVNGVMINHRRGMRTKLADGDIVSFVKAAAGG
jgi:molybdopterin converting factor small subunit